MDALRVRYRERTVDLDVDYAAGNRWEPVGNHLGTIVLGLAHALVYALTHAVRAAWWVATELLCLGLSAVGMVGRGADAVGCAAARRSWLITSVRMALPQRDRYPEIPANRTVHVQSRPHELTD
jgi:hypothetical protein